MRQSHFPILGGRFPHFCSFPPGTANQKITQKEELVHLGLRLSWKLKYVIKKTGAIPCP
jgi:hypothetical protein